MDRRAFVAGSLGAASVYAERASAAQGMGAQPASKSTLALFELRTYRLRFGPMESRFGEFAKGVMIPALNRAGIKPVGAFTVALGPDIPTLHFLLPHSSAESLLALPARMEADAEYNRAGAAFLGLPASDPAYVKQESSLLLAFDSTPALEPPAGPQAGPSRVFELRTYESHSRAAGRKKVEMFEKGGEIAIFRRVGLRPVFFARNLVGQRLPGLTYMVVFADMAARETAWAAFRDDPAWVKLRGEPGYANADILTNIHMQLLRPTDYSQI